MNHLKAWWMAHLTLIAAIVAFFVPSIDAYLSAHPKSTVVILLWAWIQKLTKSPLQTVAAVLVLMFVLAPIPCTAQTATPPAVPQPVTQTWGIQTSVVALPGGKSSFAGADAGVSFTPTPNFDLTERNLVSSDGKLVFNAPGFNYRFPALSIGANNASQNVNFLRVQFGITGSAGFASTPTGQHVGWSAGAFANYLITPTGSWTLAAKVEYARFPGYGNTPVISLNPAFHF